MSEENGGLKKLKKILPPLPPPFDDLDTDLPDDPFDLIVDLNNNINVAQTKLDDINNALTPSPLTGLPRGLPIKKPSRPISVPKTKVPAADDIDSIIALIDKGDLESAAKSMTGLAHKTDCPACAGYLNKAALEVTTADLSRSLKEKDWDEYLVRAKNDLIRLKKALEEVGKE